MNRTEVESIRKEYPVGTELMCDFMDDPYHPVPKGTIGTVMCVDDFAIIHVNWKNGSSLGLIIGVDKFHKL